MARAAMMNFHLPLPSELYSELRQEAERTRRPATELARAALEDWLKQRQRAALHEEIAEFAREYSGTQFDLDPQLEQAGIDAIQHSSRRKK